MPVQAGSAAEALQAAFVTALAADAVFVGPPAVAVYSGVAPTDATGDYAVVNDISEGAFTVFANRGSRLVVTLNLWTLGEGTMRTLAVYAGVRRALDHVTLAIPGHRHIEGSTALLTTRYDAPARRRQGVVRYEATTLGATP